MEKEKFISLIEEINDYCDCKDILYLKKLDERGRHLDDICSSLLNKKNKTTQEQEIYEENLSKLLECGITYQQELKNLINKGSLILYNYNPKKNYEKERVNIKQAVEILEDNGIMSANCFYCDQQIELIDYLF